ncbi:MAG: hypothetical protein KAI74_01550 [Kiritimatiellae bacterium]|nr:hypothetical protein [Kiritimatiellia bacterium]
MCKQYYKSLVLVFMAVFLFLCSASGDTLLAGLSTLDAIGIETTSSVFTNALSLDIDTPYGGPLLIIANYNAQITIGARTKGSWRFESGGRTSSVNNRFLSDTKDLGIGSLVFVGTNSAVGTTTINLQHATDNKPLITSHANMLALPLTTADGNLLSYGFLNNASTVTVTSISFIDISATASVSVVLSDSAVLVSCSVNTSAPDGAETGEWKLQYKLQDDTVWEDLSYSTKRNMSGTDDTGSIILHALAESLEVGQYDIRLVARSVSGSAVNSFNSSLAVVNLAYSNGLDGGSFSAVSVSSLGGQTSLSVAVPVSGASVSFTPPVSANLISLSSFSGIPIGAKNQSCEYDIALTNLLSTQVNQHNGRYFSDAADWGSGGCTAFFTNLSSSSYTLTARHSTDSLTIGTSNVTVIGVSTESIILDSDNDGMPNDYEYFYFGDATNATATVDQDGDGVDNLGEYITCNDPTDSNSVFSATVAMEVDQKASIGWTSSANRFYDVYWTSNILNEFSSIQTNIVYPQNSYTDLAHPLDAIGFYRVHVRLP